MTKQAPSCEIRINAPRQDKHRKTLKAMLASALFAAVWQPAWALEGTSAKLVDGMQVSTSSVGVATYYFFSSTGWGAAGCPGAQWAYIYSDRIGSRELLALVMQARQINKTVVLTGNCAGPAYFQVQEAQVQAN
jgi:hypothetical protein